MWPVELEEAMHITTHADARMNQRSIRKTHIALVLEHGEAEGDKLVLTPKAARKKCETLRQEMKTLEEIAKKGGVAAIIDGDKVITTYRLSSFCLFKAKNINV
jgi:hypothetical protein